MKRLTTMMVALGLMAAGSACTELDVTPLTAKSSPPIEGLAYNLPFTQFELTVTRTLNRCPTIALPNLGFDTKVALVSATSQPDPTQEYGIDLTSLSSFWKTSDLKITLNNGMLQQFNASAADQTGAVVVNTVTALGTIAATVATAGVGGGPAAPACNSGVVKALAHKSAKNAAGKTLDDLLQDATDKLTVDTAALKTLTGAAAAMGTRLNPASQSLIAAAAQAVVKDTAEVSAKQKPVAEYQKTLTHTVTFRWPMSGEAEGAATASPYQEVALPGIELAITQWMDHLSAKKNYILSHIRLQRVPGAETVPPVALPPKDQSTADTNAKNLGLRYRIPARGQLIVCQVDPPAGGGTYENVAASVPHCDDATVPSTIPATSASIWEGMVPQLGRVQYLPYENGIFENNVLSATFNIDGTLAVAEYQEATSAGATASNALNQATTSIAGTAKTVATAQTAKLNAEAAQLQAQNSVVSAQAAATTAQQTALAQANTALANALAAQIQAQQALGAAQANAAASP